MTGFPIFTLPTKTSSCLQNRKQSQPLYLIWVWTWQSHLQDISLEKILVLFKAYLKLNVVPGVFWVTACSIISCPVPTVFYSGTYWIWTTCCKSEWLLTAEGILENLVHRLNLRCQPICTFLVWLYYITSLALIWNCELFSYFVVCWITLFLFYFLIIFRSWMSIKKPHLLQFMCWKTVSLNPLRQKKILFSFWITDEKQVPK